MNPIRFALVLALASGCSCSSDDPDTDTAWYCGGDGRLYRVNIGAQTETLLEWPIATMTCHGSVIEYLPSRGTILFAYEQNRLSGIAEHREPF